MGVLEESGLNRSRPCAETVADSGGAGFVADVIIIPRIGCQGAPGVSICSDHICVRCGAAGMQIPSAVRIDDGMHEGDFVALGAQPLCQVRPVAYCRANIFDDGLGLVGA